MQAMVKEELPLSNLDDFEEDEDEEEVIPEEVTQLLKAPEKQPLKQIVKPKLNSVVTAKEKILQMYGSGAKTKVYPGGTKTTTVVMTKTGI